MLPAIALGLLLAAVPYGPDPDAAPEAAPAEEQASGEDARAAFFAWNERIQARYQASFPSGHPEPTYRFAAEVYGPIADLARANPGLISVEQIGTSVQGRPIWAFHLMNPSQPIRERLLVFAGIHALEWISVEVATATLLELTELPPPGVEIVVVPILNIDGRFRAERDLADGKRRYRRANANGVDLNRDFAANRESEAVWQHIVPQYYGTSPAPLSQPESRAIDGLAATGFDVIVSLHAFGGYIYYPWAGHWDRVEDRRAFHELGTVMAQGQGHRPYQVKQLSHWGFFFRGLGMEVDHFYATYGAYSFLIELTRSGIEPLRPSTWKDPYRFYNPIDPSRATRDGLGALRAMAWHLSWNGTPPRQREGPPLGPDATNKAGKPKD